MMLERAKSLVLVLLVGLSFFLTFQLWGNNPSFDPLTPANYEQPKNIGDAKEWKDLIKPQKILFHDAENHHTMATSKMAPYGFLWDAMQMWQFTNLREAKLETADWEKILASNGVEFIFPERLPSILLAKLLQVPDNLTDRISFIDRIWVYREEDRPDFTALFISGQERKVYASKLIDVSQDHYFDLPNLIALGSQLPEQAPVLAMDNYFQIYYLPLERGSMMQWTYEAEAIDVQEMVDALFLDTSAIKEISERSGTRIFTDGTKSLQYNENTHDMRFYVPFYERSEREDQEEELLQTLDFMNNHRGWTGEYLFDHWQDELDHRQFRFREFMEGYPLYGETASGMIGEIWLRYQSNQVSEYRRSLIRIKGAKRFYQISILSGQEVLDYLKGKGIYLQNIKNIELGYQAIYDESSAVIKLIPAYIVHLHATRDPIIIDARVFTLEG